MKYYTQAWDRIAVQFSIILSGRGQTGLTPTVTIRRVQDGLFLASGGLSWQVGAVTNNLVEVDSVNMPGLYQYSIPAVALDFSLGQDGYQVYISEATLPVAEQHFITPKNNIAEEVFNQDISVYTTENTMGDAVMRSLAIRQNNTRIVYDSFAANGTPTHGYVYVYKTKAILASDVSPYPLALGSYEFTATVDGSLRVVDYVSTRES